MFLTGLKKFYEIQQNLLFVFMLCSGMLYIRNTVSRAVKNVKLLLCVKIKKYTNRWGVVIYLWKEIACSTKQSNISKWMDAIRNELIHLSSVNIEPLGKWELKKTIEFWLKSKITGTGGKQQGKRNHWHSDERSHEGESVTTCFWMITFLEKDLYGSKIVISCVLQNLQECTEE